MHSDGETQLKCKTMKWGSIPRLSCTKETKTKILFKNLFKVLGSCFKKLNTSSFCNSIYSSLVEEKRGSKKVLGSSPPLDYLFSFTIILFSFTIIYFKHAFDQQEKSLVYLNVCLFFIEYETFHFFGHVGDSNRDLSQQ